ncbi:thioredoxin-like [Discoglossus pictus]
MVKEISTMSDFKAAMTESEKCLVVIDFTAVWCGPCQKIKPVFEQLSKKHSDVVFYKADVDEANDVASECGIRAMPTFQFYKCGKKIGEISGADPAALEKKIQELK